MEDIKLIIQKNDLQYIIQSCWQIDLIRLQSDVQIRFKDELAPTLPKILPESSGSSYISLNVKPPYLNTKTSEERQHLAVMAMYDCVQRLYQCKLMDTNVGNEVQWKYVGNTDNILYGPYDQSRISQWVVQNQFNEDHWLNLCNVGIWVQCKTLHYIFSQGKKYINFFKPHQQHGYESSPGDMSSNNSVRSAHYSPPSKLSAQGRRNSSGDEDDYMDIQDIQQILDELKSRRGPDGDLRDNNCLISDQPTPMEGLELFVQNQVLYGSMPSQLSLSQIQLRRVLFLVDSNILLGSMRTFVQSLSDLRKAKEESPEVSVHVMIPFVVLSELDKLKESKKSQKDGEFVSDIARRAITMINTEMKTTGNCLKVQPFQDYKSANQDYICSVVDQYPSNDEQILQSCLYYFNQKESWQFVGLLTNDVNLQLRANSCQIEHSGGNNMRSFILNKLNP